MCMFVCVVCFFCVYVCVCVFCVCMGRVYNTTDPQFRSLIPTLLLIKASGRHFLIFSVCFEN